jgi:hypothetical protein
MRTSAGFLVALTLALAGCGGGSSSATEFEGEERAVADAIEEIQTAAQRRDQAKMCRELVARSLREKIASGGSSCDKEVEKALEDADALELVVRDVNVTGTTAEATVGGEAGDGTKPRTMKLVKEDGRWRAASFGA